MYTIHVLHTSIHLTQPSPPTGYAALNISYILGAAHITKIMLFLANIIAINFYNFGKYPTYPHFKTHFLSNNVIIIA